MSGMLAACLLLAAQAQPARDGRGLEQLLVQFRKDWNSQTGNNDERARQALVALGLPAVASLVRELTNADPGVATASAAALGDIGEPAIPALVATLEGGADDPSFLAANTLLGLGRSGSDLTPATKAALAAAKRTAPGVRTRSVEMLGLIVSQARLPPAQAETVLSALAGALEDPDVAVQVTAAQALQRFGPAAARAVPALEKLLGSKDDFARDEAKDALARIRAPLADAVRALQDADVNIRRRAVLVLGLTGPAAREALPALKTVAAKDEDSSLRAAAVEAMRRIEAK